MKARYYIIVAILVLFFIGIRFVGQIGRERVDDYTVVRVIDGDTFELQGRGTVRLLGIDTPEKGEPFYDSALICLKNLTLGKRVSLEFDHRTRDNYGRLLAYAFVDDTILVNAELLKRGFAGLYLFPDNRDNAAMVANLLDIQRDALARNAGIWALPHHMEEQYICNTRTFRFHRPECSGAAKISAQNRKIVSTREEALNQGYSPCRNCKP